MADPRTFVLIGDFQDNITPALEGINRTIASFKRNMASMATKRGGGYNDVTQSVGKLVSAQKHLKEAIEGVGAAAKVATGELKDYKSMLGKVSSAHYHIQKSGTAAGKAQSKFWQGANKELEEYGRNMVALQKRTKIRPYPSLMADGKSRSSRTRTFGGITPPGGGPPGGGLRPVSVEREGRRRRTNIGESGLSASFAFGQQLGFGLTQPVQSAIFSGFQMGVGLMAKTMEYVQSSFAERVQDQMTDLQTAGGYYAIAKRQKDPMFTSLQSAIRFTQETNLVMSRLASDLPGSTEDYVKVSKRIGDSVMRLVDQNEKGSIAYAQQLITKGGLQEQYKNISLEGPGAREGAISVILGELTKKTVLAGFGGSSGRGGAAGPYGLPALMERLITQPDTSMASLNKYASVFGDPKIMAGLERAEEKLKKAGSNMLERAKVVNEFLDEVVPPEMIAAMRKSMAGMMEAYRSAFFDPEMGLFGFGRKIEGLLQPMVNEFGQFVKEEVDANGKKMYTVVNTAGAATQITLGVFEQFSDIVSNYGAIIKPIVDNLYLLWDPLEGLAHVLKDVRIISTQLLSVFRMYDDALKQEVERLGAETDKGKMLGMTRSIRASLLTIFSAFTDLNIISEDDFLKYREALIDPTKGIKDFAGMVKEAITTFFDSKAGFNAGKFVGEMLREVAISLSEFTGFISQLGATQLAQGFMAGFGEEGVKAVQKIFVDIYKILLEVAKAVIPLIPWQVYALAAAGIVIPAAIAFLGVKLADGVVGMLSTMTDFALGKLAGAGKGGKLAEASNEIVEAISEVAEKAAKNTRKVRVTTGAEKVREGTGRYVTRATGKGTGGRYIRSIRDGNVTVSGRGITRSGDAVTGGAKVTQSLPEAIEPPKPSKFKNFLKGALGVDESLLGRPLVDFVKNILPAVKTAFAKLVSAFKGLTPVLTGMGAFFGTVQSGLGGKLVTLKSAFSDFDMFIEALGGLFLKVPGIKQIDTLLDTLAASLGDFDFKVAADDAAKGFKNFFGKGKGLLSLSQDFAMSLSDDFVAFFGKTGKTLVDALLKLDDVVLSWIEGSVSIRTELSALLTPFKNAFTGLKNVLFDWIEGSFSIRTELGAALRNFGKKFQNFFAKAGDFLAAPARGGLNLGDKVKGAAAGAKGLAVRIVGFGSKGVSNVKGGIAGLLSGAKGAKEGSRALIRQRGLGGNLARGAAKLAPGRLLSKGMKGLGKFGGIATVGVGIFEALMSLLSGDSLGTALGKGAGPVLGTIIGTALLGPLGGLIGGWIGGMESVTRPLGDAFESLMGSVDSVFTLLSLAGGDISNFVGSLFGLGKEFSLLEYAINVLLSPFRLLNIALLGIVELYLRAKKFFQGGYLNAEDQRMLDKTYLKRLEESGKEEIKWRAGMNKEFLSERKEELEKLKAEGGANTDRARQLGFMIDEITKNLKDKADETRKVGTKSTLNNREVVWDGKEWKPTGKPGAPSAPKPPAAASPYKVGPLTKNGVKGWQGSDGTWTPLQQNTPPTARNTGPALSPMTQAFANVFSAINKHVEQRILANTEDLRNPKQPGGVAKEVSETAKNTSDIDQKAKEQITQATQTRDAAKKTEKNTTTSVTTLGNIKAGVIAISNKVGGLQTAILGDLNNIQAGVAKISSLLSSGTLKVKAEGVGPNNGPMGTAKGDLGRAQNLAGQYGLSMTSWFRSGDKGYHGVGRAMDFSNGVSTPQQMEFAQAMVNQYGTTLKELIYTPLGFGIKDGTRVPLSYWGAATNVDHYDHVHVAFANGIGNPIVTPTGDMARRIDEQALGKANVKTYTAGKGEFGGGDNITVNAPITINGAGLNAEDIAYAVAGILGDEIERARSASIFT